MYDRMLAFDFWLALKCGARAGESISGYVYRLELGGDRWAGVWRKCIDSFFRALYGQQDHCAKSYQRELSRKPPTP